MGLTLHYNFEKLLSIKPNILVDKRYIAHVIRSFISYGMHCAGKGGLVIVSSNVMSSSFSIKSEKFKISSTKLNYGRIPKNNMMMTFKRLSIIKERKTASTVFPRSLKSFLIFDVFYSGEGIKKVSIFNPSGVKKI